MKNQSFLHKLGIVLVACSAFIGCCPKDDGHVAKSIKTTYPIPGEDLIFLELSEVASGDGVREIRQTTVDIQWAGETQVAYLAAEISTTAVNNFSAQIYPSPPASCTNYIRGIKIVLGAFAGTVGQELSLMFVPVLMCRTDVYPEPDGSQRGIYEIMEGDCYKYNGTAFEPCADSENLINGYLQTIRIKDGGNFRNHNGLHGVDGDVTSMIFSLQEILAVIQQNQPTQSLKIWNSIRMVQNRPKHTLLLSGSQPDDEPYIKDFRGKYANLSHLCPPSCNGDKITYKIHY